MGLEQLPQRFQDKIQVDLVSKCWIWTSVTDRCGYGRVSVAGRKVMAHRAVYNLLIGPIGNKELDHTCCTRNCVNPDHLEKVTRKMNCRLRDKRGRK